MQQTAHRPKNATLERGMLLTIRAPPSYPCRSVCYSGAPRRSPPAWARRYSCGLKPSLSMWKPLRAIFRFRHQDAQTPPSPRVGEGGRGDEGQKAQECRTPRIALTNAPLDRGNTPHHACASVLSVPIRVLFRLTRAKRLRGLDRIYSSSHKG